MYPKWLDLDRYKINITNPKTGVEYPNPLYDEEYRKWAKNRMKFTVDLTGSSNDKFSLDSKVTLKPQSTTIDLTTSKRKGNPKKRKAGKIVLPIKFQGTRLDPGTKKFLKDEFNSGDFSFQLFDEVKRQYKLSKTEKHTKEIIQEDVMSKVQKQLRARQKQQRKEEAALAKHLPKLEKKAKRKRDVRNILSAALDAKPDVELGVADFIAADNLINKKRKIVSKSIRPYIKFSDKEYE